MSDFVPVDPATSLLAISKMSVPAAGVTAITRILNRAPVALQEWETAVGEFHSLVAQYMTYNPNIQPIQSSDSEEINWIYTPLVLWPMRERSFLSDVFDVVSIIADAEMPEAFQNLKTALQAWVTVNGYHLTTNQTNVADSDPHLSICGKLVSVLPVDYEGYSGTPTIQEGKDLIYAINLALYGLSQGDLTVLSPLRLMFSYPLVPVYCILKFLREDLPATARPGAFVSDDQFAALEDAVDGLMPNT